MKKAFGPLPLMVITLGFMIALAPPALASKGDHYKGLFRGLGTEAYSNTYDENTGVYTDIMIYAVDELTKNPPGGREKTQYANIYISQYLYDADEYVPIRDVYFYGPLLSESLVVNRSLSAAVLTAYGLEGWEWDYAAETETPVAIDINASWSATGPKSNHNSHYHDRSPYGISNYHSTGKSREGSALGEIIIDGLSLMFEAAGSAYIYSAKSGYIEIIR